MTICFSVYNVNTLRTLVISVFTYIHYQLSNIGRFIGDLKMTATYKDELVQTLWDLFKEVHGVRPRGMGYEKYSVTDLEHEVARLQRSLEEEIRHEREMEDRAINSCMDCGASDIATAMRWLEDAYEMEWV